MKWLQPEKNKWDILQLHAEVLDKSDMTVWRSEKNVKLA